MVTVNHDYLDLQGSYLFSTIAKKVAAYQTEHPEAKIIRMGIGDVTQPLVPAVIEALHKAVDEQSSMETFHGYAPDLGYTFLREKIVAHDYEARGAHVELDEVFISDGAKGDVANIQEIFGRDNKVAVGDPVYPVYVDSNVMSGRTGTYNAETETWSDLTYLSATSENDFIPSLPTTHVDLIYLCYPNNPTGTTLTKEALQEWVDYANKEDAVIIYDSAYEAFITEEEIPHSIYEIEGARTCAIEVRSFSKTAGFTGLRLGYMVVPKELVREGVALRDLWARRHGTKFNGAPYIVSRAGEAVYSEEGKKQVKEQIAYYLRNAKTIREYLTEAGYEVFGGVNAPYVWAKTPKGMTSWAFFDFLLEEKNIVVTPGSGFGPSGEGYVRFSAFGNYESVQEAMQRITK
ncbi:aminotransferases class-i pyridoxal-phosphate attachment site [Trichococcus palustris]|jgi:LL-diaminopimelate aminotransferase|uniref:Aminotransferase n=1 Tax=Trichococcus palustris TaxID=140314 RepID=A0A143YYW5_9LACT|nr:LL-diaminopimelate aminotransferase [Trichococcus palustris]CZR00639.1 aminotransferases class-i pyridoxal-phosphate attachment site [Trichococcus palustris]SFK89824.1 LL-diaminopimelate aminotransferase apoenzyme [Trichococcus palustris]